MGYVGRFAPSPTGELHLGTLTTAVASFLHARQAGGEWLLRIEDIDPPREVPGSADSILRTLEALDLEWDRDVLYQSTRLDRYRQSAAALLDAGEAFYCRCSRQQIRALTGSLRYPGTCRDRSISTPDVAIRLRVEPGRIQFRDRLSGPVEYDIANNEGDFVIVRRDGLPAYHLAVVYDDADQGVTDVVRGSDLLTSTPLHIHLQQRLGLPSPRYWHLPLVTNRAGEKLSKSSGAPPIDLRQRQRAAAKALTLLGLSPPKELSQAPPGELWLWAIPRWQINRVSARSITPHGHA